MNKVRFTCEAQTEPLGARSLAARSLAAPFSYQVVLLVVHLGGVSSHAVDGEQQVHEGERRVQPQQVGPAGASKTV